MGRFKLISCEYRGVHASWLTRLCNSAQPLREEKDKLFLSAFF